MERGWLLMFLLMFSGLTYAKDASSGVIRLIDNHRSAAVILVAPQASAAVLQAASLLSQYLYQSTQARLPIHHENAAAANSLPLTIHLGLTTYVQGLELPLAQLDEDGFLITFPDQATIVIAGPTDWGTEFGVYEFLERYVGVRWLLPGPAGEHVPEQTTLDIPRREIRAAPAFFSRALDGLPNTVQTTWARRNRMHGKIAFIHNLYRLFPPTQYTQTHPEYFPIIDGKRYLPAQNTAQDWQPCFSAPGIAAEAIKNICAYFAAHPAETTYSLGMNDSITFCESDQNPGKRNFLGLTDVSDSYFQWANAVAAGVLQRYPDKWFGCLAYSNLAEPPVSVTVHPRIIPYLTYDRLKWVASQFEQQGQKLTAAWAQAAALPGWYDYIYGTPYLLPRVYFHKMAEYYRYGYQQGVRALNAEAYPNWGEGPKLYLALKLQWHPYADVDALLADWYACAVGPAAAPDLAAYYALWEEFWTVRVPSSPWFQHQGQWLRFNEPSYLNLATYQDLARSRQLLAQVAAKTQTAEQRARAELLRRAFEYYEASAVSYLGLVRHAPQPEQTQDADYYEKMKQKRLRLLNEFAQDPVLMHPLRFDRYPRLQW